MKVAIIGSRDIADLDAAYTIISDNVPRNCSEIVSGGAVGIDTVAEKYAAAHHLAMKRFLPEYEKYGKKAPLMRNTEIVEYADMVIAFWDMESHGTADTLQKCIESGKPLKIFKVL